MDTSRNAPDQPRRGLTRGGINLEGSRIVFSVFYVVKETSASAEICQQHSALQFGSTSQKMGKVGGESAQSDAGGIKR